MSTTEWRNGGAERWSKQRKANRKTRKAPRRRPGHARRMSITVWELPAYHIAYMRHVGPYGAGGIPRLWQKFTTWMETRALAGPDAIKLGIGRDNPAVTAPKKCRYDACVVVPKDFVADKWVNVTDVPAGRYAVKEFVGTPDEIGVAWDDTYRSWLPASGYQPEERPCLEIYRGKPGVSGRPGAFRCELCVPVRPL